MEHNKLKQWHKTTCFDVMKNNFLSGWLNTKTPPIVACTCFTSLKTRSWIQWHPVTFYSPILYPQLFDSLEFPLIVLVFYCCISLSLESPKTVVVVKFYLQQKWRGEHVRETCPCQFWLWLLHWSTSGLYFVLTKNAPVARSFLLCSENN